MPLNTADIKAETIEVIRDIGEYLAWLKDTGVDELPLTPSTSPRASLPLSHPHPISPPPFLSMGGMEKGRGRGNVREQKAGKLDLLRKKIGDCRRCKLWKGRTNIVFGTGNPDARLLFVGEGPGEEEDIQGEPFVGKAGALLTKMIEAMGLTRDEVYIANVVKCRPPENRNPEGDEISACKPFLEEQIEIIKPQVICALGTFAAQTLLETRSRISELRGRIQEKEGHKIVPTFHPAYLLRNPQEKRLAWEDLKIIMKVLGLKDKGNKGG